MSHVSSIYQHQSAFTFVSEAIGKKKELEPGFSLRKFCKFTDFGSHALLVMVLKRKRRLNLSHVPALAKGLGLQGAESVYLQTLIQLDNANSEEEKNLYRLWLNDLKPSQDYKVAHIENYQVIADWIHMAILTCAKLDLAQSLTPKMVFNACGKKVEISVVQNAFDRLIHLGLLHSVDGKIKPTHASVRTTDDVSNRGVREHHRQVSRLAIDATEEQDPSEREFQAFAVTLPKEKLTLAKEMIRKFRHQLVQVLEAEPGHEVYQCNLQFFRLAHNPSNEILSSEVIRSKEMTAQLGKGEKPMDLQY